MQRSHSPRSSSSPHAIASYEWVRANVLKYQSCITFAASVVALQHQLRLASPEDSCKIAVQACGSDDFPFLRVSSNSPSFFCVLLFLEHSRFGPALEHIPVCSA